MKLINLILLLFPLTGFSQVTGFTKSNAVMDVDTLPTTTLEYYINRPWNNWSTELVKGKVETPVNVIDSGMKVEVVETRDTIYKCPISMTSYTVQYFNSKGEIENHIRPNNCTLDKIVTTRRYKLYIINEYGQKEYLLMELTKTK